MILEIADCDRTSASLRLDDRRGPRELAAQARHAGRALRVFRTALVEEFEPYDERGRQLDALRE